MMAGQEWDPNIFLKMVIIAGGPAHTPTIEFATYKTKLKLSQAVSIHHLLYEKEYGIIDYK